MGCGNECIGIRGPTSIVNNTMVEYEIYYNAPSCSAYNYPVRIYISYVSGTIFESTELAAPLFVDIPAGQSSKKINILANIQECKTRSRFVISTSLSSNEIQSVCENISISVTGGIINDCLGTGSGDGEAEDLINDAEKCGQLFFFPPYHHRTKKASNMR